MKALALAAVVAARVGAAMPSTPATATTAVAETSAAATAARRDALLRDGVTVVPGVLEENLLQTLRTAAAELVADDAHAALRRDPYTGSLISVSKDERLAELIGHAATLEAFKELGLGDDARWLSGYVISKPPKSPSLGWHQDAWYWDRREAYETAPLQIFAMYYLSDTRPENGCLRVLPGSHRAPRALHAVLGEAHGDAVRNETDWAASPAHRRCDGEVDVAVRAGDLVVGDARVLHGAHPNDSDERRTVITMWHMPAFASREASLRRQVAAFHSRLSQDVYLSWPRALLEPLRPHLPVDDADAVRDELRAAGDDVDDFDQSLGGYVRTPGWTGADARSRRAWEEICGGGGCVSE